jgi:hypothetical protein
MLTWDQASSVLMFHIAGYQQQPKRLTAKGQQARVTEDYLMGVEDRDWWRLEMTE